MPSPPTEQLERFRILVVDDSLDNLMILSATLDQPGYEIVVASSGHEALARAAERRPDIVLLDVRMPGLDGLATCRRLKNDPSLRDVPVLFMSGLDRIEDRVAAFDAGGVDFVGKPFHPAEVQARVKTHLALASLHRALGQRAADLEREVEAAHAFRGDLLAAMMAPLQGESAAARALRAALALHAEHDEPVLIRGAAADGAEAAARAIHEASSRRWRPFVRAEPGTPPDTPLGDSGRHPLMRSILGRAALAEGGTLYVENVDGLSPAALSELARVVERGDDVRLIVQAAGPGLPSGLPAGLAQHLAARVVALPGLDARREDIPQICCWILAQHAARLGKSEPLISRDELSRLVAYPWRGGLAELEAVVRRALLVSPDGTFAVELERLEEGRRLGSYRLIERLGEGGMGEVWRAKHELLPRPCAVKIISTKATRENLHRAQLQFRREATAIWELQSPHTVRVHDFGASDDGELYYAMELLDGLDLHWMVRVDGRLVPARVVHLLRQAASSLAEAHGLGLVHRDIKPANLFVSRQGLEYDWLKVLDFGTVTVEGSDTAERVFGTAGFLAPELITREGQPSSASDVYALGCCAYWCLVGAPAFSAPTAEELARLHVEGPAPSPSAAVDGLSPTLDRLVVRCMSRHPGDRPSAIGLVEALEALARVTPWPRAAAQSWWRERGAGAHEARGADPSDATSTLHDVGD